MINKRKRGKWIKWVAVLALAAGLCVFAWPSLSAMLPGSGQGNQRSGGTGSSRSGDSASGVKQGSFATAQKGNLQVTVYGSGSLTPSEKSTVYSAAAGTVTESNAAVGDTVGQGDVLLRLSSDDLASEIASLESALFEARQTLSAVRDSGSDTSVYAPASGRVKTVYAQKNDDVATVMSQYGSLLVISRDGKMKVVFETPAGSPLSAGESVTVWVGAEALAGAVASASDLNGKTTVTIDDDTYDAGTSAMVQSSLGEKLGEGTLEINMPVPVTGVGGAVKTVYYEEGDAITSGSRLFYLTGKIPSAELKQALLAYDEAQLNLENARAKQESLVIRAPMDGVISEINASTGDPLAENTAILKIQGNERFQALATVDELDIAEVKVGQSAIVELDAYPDQSFDAMVSKVSGVGTVSGGVATYEVTVQLNEGQGLMDGMTASVDVVVADKQGVLLVPVEAISTSGGKKYVTLADGKTANVTTGLADGENIEILEGISEGDSVLITRSSSTGAVSAFPAGMGGMGGSSSGRTRDSASGGMGFPGGF